MGRIKTGPNQMVQWYEIVKEAQSSYGIVLTEDLEHYLTALLQRFLDKPEIASEILASQYLASREETGYFAQQKFREVGDKCLLLSGMFPEVAGSRQVPIKYFVEMGKSAYHLASESYYRQEKSKYFYEQLCHQFVTMMDVLHCLRELGGYDQTLSVKIATELYREVGSEHARLLLLRNVGPVPIQKILKAA